MKIERTQLAEIIGEKTLHITDHKELAHSIAAYLLSENREHELESLMRDILAYRAHRGIVEATITSAHPLSEDVTDRVEQLLKERYPSAKEVIVRDQLDPALVGGLTVTTADEQLDLSIRSKLGQFKRLITEGSA